MLERLQQSLQQRRAQEKKSLESIADVDQKRLEVRSHLADVAREFGCFAHRVSNACAVVCEAFLRIVWGQVLEGGRLL